MRRILLIFVLCFSLVTPAFADDIINVPQQDNQSQLVRPYINGNDDFKRVVTQALDLLERYDYPHYVMVCQNAKSIEYVRSVSDGEREGLAGAIYGKIFIARPLVKDRLRFTPQSIAGVIVHEATHLLHEKYGKNYFLNRENHEAVAFEHQVTALILVRAPQWLVDENINWRTIYYPEFR